MTAVTSRGKILSDTLRKNLSALWCGPSDISNRVIIWNVTSEGTFVNGLTADTAIAQVSELLLTKKIFNWEHDIYLEMDQGEDQRLFPISIGRKAEPNATSFLSNFFVVGLQKKDSCSQSFPPTKLVNAVLASDGLWRKLPTIQLYARRPVFDGGFSLRGPGWHAQQGILIHGPDITPVTDSPICAADARVIDRLPPYMKRLLEGFCWATEADLANTVGMLLTGVLGNHFIEEPKPIFLIDGNQRGVGKTLLCQVIGRVLDGVEPPRVPIVRDEELEKKLCAVVREARGSILFFDNVRSRIESPLIEANALSPLLSFRLLGHSTNITRPNNYLWIITSNQTSGTEDLISRSLPIRLYHEGNPRERQFNEADLIRFVNQYRQDILGELAGMVLRWRQAGMPKGLRKHRCVLWAETVGGILQVAGIDHFLENIEDAEATMDEGLQMLAALAEYFETKRIQGFFTTDSAKTVGKSPKDWAHHASDAKVFPDSLAAMSPKGRDTWIGKFLSGKVNRTVCIQTHSGEASATLRRRDGSGRQKLYHFEIAANPSSEGEVIRQDDDPGLDDIPGPARPLGIGTYLPLCGEEFATSPFVHTSEATGNNLRWG